ncbi:3'-5' exoribonuclease [Listeria phage LPJP1]|nr:3'-5' exoribonuclease [Listeria phage LPJP1]
MDNKIYFDTEFTNLTKDADLISIGMVDTYGRLFYAEVSNFDTTKSSVWVNDNVIPKLRFFNKHDALASKSDNAKTTIVYGTKDEVSDKIIEWLSYNAKHSSEKLVFVSDLMAYDWMLFVDLINKGKDATLIPEFVDMYYYDISTVFRTKNIDPDINREEFASEYINVIVNEDKHNALWDAIVIQACDKRLQYI